MENTTLATTKTAVDRLNKSLEKSNLDALVQAKTRRSLLLVDCSGSMRDRIRTGERKIDALRKVVVTLREQHPVPVAAFGARENVVLVNEVPEPCGSTPLASAIDYGRTEGASHLVVVTDGQPDSETDAFEAARQFKGPVDVFYIGDGNDHGARFSRELAEMTGGSINLTDLGDPKRLVGKIAGLLGEATV